MRSLTSKQERFADEYLVDLNATQAAIRAGYSPRSADKIGPELLGKTGVQEVIRARQALLRDRVEIRQLEVLAALAAIAFADMGDYVDADGVHLRPLHCLTRHQRLAIAHSRQLKDGFELRLHNKARALVLLGRHLGMF